MTLLRKTAHSAKNTPSFPTFISRFLHYSRDFLKLIRDRIRDKLSYIFLSVHKSFFDIAIYSPGNKSFNSIVLLEYKKSIVYFMDIKQGEYRLYIEHTDRLVQKERRSLFAYVDVSVGRADWLVKVNHALAIAQNGKPFCYLGGGKSTEGVTTQSFTLVVPSNQPWIRISLQSRLKRIINLDTVALVPLYKPSSQRALPAKPSTFNQQTPPAKTIAAWIGRTSRVMDATAILYADIDLNVVDGSSVWLASMGSILSGNGPCVLIAKKAISSDVVTSNIVNQENLIVLSPDQVGSIDASFTVETAISLIRALDEQLPAIRQVVIRGLQAATLLCETRQFRERSAIYLTDFYNVTADGVSSTQAQQAAVAACAVQAGTILIQTPAIERRLRDIANYDFRAFLLPPPVPDSLPVREKNASNSDRLTIGYAGKITANWGLSELAECAMMRQEVGQPVDLHIVANKVSGNDGKVAASQLRKCGANHYTNLNRQAAMQMMARMDFVWCWRPAHFEDVTLELSTKLVEGVAAGWRCICYPSATNRALLGDDYPFFAKSPGEALHILTRTDVDLPDGLSERLFATHSLAHISKRFEQAITSGPKAERPRRVVFAGHDYKFIDPYISHLKKQGHLVRYDVWGWGDPLDVERSAAYRDWADIVFCEWGLANAVWHSRNPAPDKKLFIRMHLQEVNARARRFGAAINIENVEKVIFVQEEVRSEALRLWKWPKEKTLVVPNFLLTEEYKIVDRVKRVDISLGMVGIIPQRKRFDRAVGVLSRLRAEGYNAKLYIKGPRPETVDFMQAPGRSAELEYYNEVYERIKVDPLLDGQVIFEGWGNDVAIWYRKIDHILSCSDFESFHYALADGVLTGCQPVIWPWDGADRTYRNDWIVADEASAVHRILDWHRLPKAKRQKKQNENRTFLAERYGQEKIFAALSMVIGIADQ